MSVHSKWRAEIDFRTTQIVKTKYQNILIENNIMHILGQLHWGLEIESQLSYVIQDHFPIHFTETFRLGFMYYECDDVLGFVRYWCVYAPIEAVWEVTSN